MAKIEFTGIISGMSGRCDNVVFFRNKYGICVKRYTKPSNPKTRAQQDIRGNFAHLSRQWAGLTGEQRNAWIEIAKTFTHKKKGKYFTYTGFIYFMKLNRELQEIGMPLYEDISRDTLVSPPDITNTKVEITTGAGKEDIKLKLPETLGKDTSVIVFATHILKRGRQMKSSELRIITVIHKTYKPGISIKEAYVKKFGRFPEKEEPVGFAVMAVNNVCGLTGSKIYIEKIER